MSVHWAESTGEWWDMVLRLALLPALIWTTGPAAGPRRNHAPGLAIRLIAVIVLFGGIHTASYFYYWHVRPNIGFYREPDWVAQSPVFQKWLRARIDANTR